MFVNPINIIPKISQYLNWLYIGIYGLVNYFNLFTACKHFDYLFINLFTVLLLLNQTFGYNNN